MTHAERMRSAFWGGGSDQLPWAPRMDLWYTANLRGGTLPHGLRGGGIEAVMCELDCGYHAVIPDFRVPSGPEGDAHVGLGFYNARTMPVRVRLPQSCWETRISCGSSFTEYRTPYGPLRTETRLDEPMLSAGISLPHVAERVFKGESDYEALRFLFDNAEIFPNPEGFQELVDRVGDRGVAFGYVSPTASPMHHILHHLMPFDTFYYESYDHPEELASLAASVEGYLRRLLEVTLSTRVEAVFWGGNYDASLTPPPFFRDHVLPFAREVASSLHASGKLLLMHTDGENKGLLDFYVESGLDIADSICPEPMTSLGLGEVLAVFGERVAVMGGIPSIALLPQSMGDQEFEKYLDRFFNEIGDGRRLVVGISDTTPPGASFERLKSISRRVQHFGPVSSSS